MFVPLKKRDKKILDKEINQIKQLKTAGYQKIRQKNNKQNKR